MIRTGKGGVTRDYVFHAEVEHIKTIQDFFLAQLYTLPLLDSHFQWLDSCSALSAASASRPKVARLVLN